MSKVSEKKYGFFFVPAIGAVLGIVLFCIIYGVRIIDPTYEDWITGGSGDIVQHYLGWVYYRNTPWKFPLGITEGLTLPDAISCIYTDSIPLFALFFKILSPVLPETFQYAGIWGVFSFAVQGFTSVVLLQKFSKNPFFCLAASTCYILMPAIFLRLYGHDSLSGHWLIILALILWVYQEHEWKHRYTPVVLWAVLGVIAPMIHMYFVPMVYIIMAGSFLSYIIKNKKIGHVLVCGSVSVLCTLGTMFSFGAFYGKGSFGDGGLGVFSANINCFINSMNCSSFIKGLDIIEGQTEGFGYMGLGMIIAGIVAMSVGVYLLIRRKNIKEIVCRHSSYIAGGAFIFMAAFILALSPVITLNNRVLYTIPYPRIVFSALSVFRASGRFIWICDYLLYTAVFMVLSRINGKKVLCIITFLVTGIQVADMYGLMKSKRSLYLAEAEYVSPLYSEKNQDIVDGITEIRFVPLPPDHLTRYDYYMTLGVYASENNIKMSSFYCARGSYESMAEYAEKSLMELENGGGQENVLYVFFDETRIPENNDSLNIYDLNGMTVGRVKYNKS